MRILQVFNMPNHHVLPVARFLAKSAGEANFRYCAMPFPFLDERQKLGFNCNEDDPWILRPGESEADKKQLERWWDDADVVLCAYRSVDRMKDRTDNSKLTFYMSERWWKPPLGMWRLFHPRFALMTARFRRLESSSYFHYLPIGGSAASDMKRIARFTGRMWKWGYFTPTPDPLPSCQRNEQRFRVLWAGRMDRLKRVDTLIKAFSKLVAARPNATLTVVGFGQEQRRLEQLAAELLQHESYEFLGAMPHRELLGLMREHHVYVFPSGGREGWGAVINEAMGEGCVVVASQESGAAKAMIRHRNNGLLFASGDWKRLGELLCEVSRDEALRIRLAREGQNTVANCWSADVAAERLLSVSESLLAKRLVPTFNDGPMSPA